MGVTIHYKGRIDGADAFQRLQARAAELAAKNEWTFHDSVEESEHNHAGFTIVPHPDCESIEFDFNKKWEVSSWVKTQFAGPLVHIRVIELFRELTPLFRSIAIEDEGEYWETDDKQLLVSHVDQINEMILEYVQNYPKVQTKVRASSGRIIDLITPKPN